MCEIFEIVQTNRAIHP